MDTTACTTDQAPRIDAADSGTTDSDTTGSSARIEPAGPAPTDPQHRRLGPAEPLCRPIQGRMLAGVAAGLARYLGADVNLVRVILAVLVCVGGAGVPLYLAGWLLIPEEGAEQSIASDLISSLENRPR